MVDRLDKRRLLYVTQSLGLLAGTFAVLIVTGTIEMWMVYLLGLGLGTLTAFDNPARQVLMAEMVPRDKLSNAVTLNSIEINVARVLGAALGGVLVAVVGLAICFALNGLSFVAVLITLVMMRTRSCIRPRRRPRRRARSGRGCVMHGPPPACWFP